MRWEAWDHPLLPFFIFKKVDFKIVVMDNFFDASINNCLDQWKVGYMDCDVLSLHFEILDGQYSLYHFPFKSWMNVVSWGNNIHPDPFLPLSMPIRNF